MCILPLLLSIYMYSVLSQQKFVVFLYFFQSMPVFRKLHFLRPAPFFIKQNLLKTAFYKNYNDVVSSCRWMLVCIVLGCVVVFATCVFVANKCTCWSGQQGVPEVAVQEETDHKFKGWYYLPANWRIRS